MNGRKTIGKRQDRLMAFFDAIMAIAMTVLALEIVIPNLTTANTAERGTFLTDLTCYFISFVAMSMLWYIHNNFFSNHDLTGHSVEMILHLVLLFVITLFQPLTRAIGQHRTDVWVQMFYILDFLVMYGLTALIMILIRKHEGQMQERHAKRRSFIEEGRKAYQLDATEESDEAKELRRMLQLVYAIENPERIQEKLAASMPEEYKQELANLKKEREASYRLALYSVLVMVITVLAAVVMLIFTIWWSYIALAVGLLVIFLLQLRG